MKIKTYKKYFAVFCISENDIQNVVGYKRVNPTITKISFRKKTFLFQVEFPTYIKGRKIYYLFNLKTGQLLLNQTSKENIINSELIDSVLSKSIINQLTTNLNAKWKVELPMLIFSAGFGGMLGFIIGSMI